MNSTEPKYRIKVCQLGFAHWMAFVYPPGSFIHCGAPTALTERLARAKAERIARLHANEYQYEVTL